MRRLCDPHVEHVAILIHRWTKVMLLATNGEDDLVEMPGVPTARTTTAHFMGVGLPKLQTPLPHRFRGHDDPALCQKFFNRTENSVRT